MKNNSPKIRFFSENDERKLNTLEEVAIFNPKSSIPRKFKYVDLESVVGTKLIAHRDEIAETAPSRAQRLAKNGDIFYQTVRPYQKNNLLFDLNDEDYVFSSGYAQLRPLIDGYYLFSQLQDTRFVETVLGMCTGTSYPAINSKTLSKIEINISNNEEELKKIGVFFKQLDKIISLQQQELDALKQTKQGFLQKMFPREEETVPEIRFSGFLDDWNDCLISDVATVSMCKRIFKEQTSENGEIPFYKIGTFGKKPDSFISQELYLEYKNKYSYPDKGDILISASGTIGRTVIYDGQESYYQDSNIIWLKRKENKISNLFLYQFYKIVNWNQVEGSTIKRLYNETILSTRIKIPSMQEQIKVGAFFRQIDEVIELKEQELEALKQTKQGFLQKMFV